MAEMFQQPGHRFHPTEREMVDYHLRRKVTGKYGSEGSESVPVIDLYGFDPWELPANPLLKTKRHYFLSAPTKKYGTGNRIKRTTRSGYWKTTGKDKDILHRSRLLGRRKTLVFHMGKATHGDPTDWVMHEYRLEDQRLAAAKIAQDTFVLCRIFKQNASLEEEDSDSDSDDDGNGFLVANATAVPSSTVPEDGQSVQSNMTVHHSEDGPGSQSEPSVNVFLAPHPTGDPSSSTRPMDSQNAVSRDDYFDISEIFPEYHPGMTIDDLLSPLETDMPNQEMSIHPFNPQELSSQPPKAMDVSGGSVSATPTNCAAGERGVLHLLQQFERDPANASSATSYK